MPEDRDALEELPGVGRKTANVVLNVAFGEPTIAVDNHIFRVSNRTGLAPGKDVLAVELGLEKRVPKKYLSHAHHWLILHGRYTCVARKPLCPTCVVRDLCNFPDKTSWPARTIRWMSPWWGDLVESIEKPIIDRGWIKVPDRPGLGITLNEDVVRQHLAPGTGYFDPTPQWNQERSVDWQWS